MKTLALRLWKEPALCIAVIAACAQAVVFLPDWRQALAAAAISLGAGGATRPFVSPKDQRGR